MFELTIDGAIACLRLVRPQARNAIPTAGWTQLAKEAAAAEAAGARLLMLAGEGPAFCAGADISEFQAFHADRDAAAAFREAMRHGLDTLRMLPIPTVALVEGACYGAGVALAIACDFRIAGPAASFAITPAKFGISYPQEDIHRLVGLVGPGQAARLLYGAVPIDAAEAARIGLVEVCAEDARAALEGLAAAIAANDANSLRTLKTGLHLTAAGHRSDPEQDGRFDELLASDVLARYLDRRSR